MQPARTRPATAILANLLNQAEANPDLKKRGHFGSIFSDNQYAWAYSQAARHCQPAEPVLDWGCGNRYFSLFLCAQGLHKVVGFAFKPPALADHLAKQPAFTFHQGEKNEPTALPFADGSFQTVFSIGVLEHVREFGGSETESLREINRILRNQGTFICAHLPNKLSVIEAMARRRGRYHHRYTFTRADIVELCASSGFQLECIQRYGMLPRNIVSGKLAGFGNNPISRNALEAVETVLSPIFKPFSQNFGFVAIKESGGPAT